MALPINIEDAGRQLRLTPLEATDRWREMLVLIADASAWVERYTGHIIEERTVEEQFNGFTSLRLRAWPINPAAVPAVTYVGGSDDDALPVPARLVAGQRPARVIPTSGRWPIAAAETLVTVTVKAGYAPTAQVPGNIRRAMLILISAYDEDREGGDIFMKAEAAAKRLCSQFRMRAL